MRSREFEVSVRGQDSDRLSWVRLGPPVLCGQPGAESLRCTTMTDKTAPREPKPADERAVPKGEDIEQIGRLHGLDRSGLGAKGWAEVPADRIGGHPELEAVPAAGPDGDLNGPQPETDPATGAPLQGGSKKSK